MSYAQIYVAASLAFGAFHLVWKSTRDPAWQVMPGTCLAAFVMGTGFYVLWTWLLFSEGFFVMEPRP